MTLINLLCMLLMTVCAALFMGTHRHGTFLIDRQKRIPENVVKKVNRDSTRLFTAKILSLILALASAVPFFLTEELTYDFQIYNAWSAYHLVLLLLFAADIALGVKGLNEEDPDAARRG